MQERADEIQQEYFKEYHALCGINLDKAVNDAEYWNSGEGIILCLPIEEQAHYADYVITKFCKLQPIEMIAALCDEAHTLDRMVGCAGIGNTALLVHTAMQSEELSTEWKKGCLERYQEFVVAQRRFRPMPWQFLCTIL